MDVIHYLGILSIKKNIKDNVGFLLTNRKGSYFSFFNQPSSRYHGLFYFDESRMNMFKFIEDIEIPGHSSVAVLKNSFYFIQRTKGDIIETYTMPKNFNSLIYELSSQNEINLILDCKYSYDNRDWGRFYEISEENGFIIIKFTKKTDKIEDKTGGIGEFELYLAVKSNNNFYKKNDKWVERQYCMDQERNSPPFRRHVYDALRLKGTKFIFSMAKNKSAAMKECEFIFNNLEQIKNKEQEEFFKILKNENVKKIITNNKIDNEIKIAYINAANSLKNLIVDNKNNYGIFAGLPWFFQFWSRDSLISLKALSNVNNEFSKKALLNYLENIKEDGRLQNLIGQHKSKSLDTADAIGWLFVRCSDLIEKLNKNKVLINSIKKSVSIIKQSPHSNSQRIKDYIKKINLILNKRENECHKLMYNIESSLYKSINGLLKSHTKDNFEFNESEETWMDTDYGDDKREGARIEMQALRLNMYRLMFELTQEHKYKILENSLKIKVKNKFWDGKSLADGLNDFTIRPNIFIAAYVYPELLTQREWETCFENALEKLWLDWGGLSTIDKNNKLFTGYNTGEDNKSYHRGDSWFWVNNLAAMQLNKINNKKFEKDIKKIIEASTGDILWKGCIGCASELSSAEELKSQGCFSQAWSNAMYTEMIDEVFK